MNPGSVFVLLIIIGIVALIIRSMVRDRKAGASCACGLPEGACGLCAKRPENGGACPSCCSSAASEKKLFRMQ